VEKGERERGIKKVIQREIIEKGKRKIIKKS